MFLLPFVPWIVGALGIGAAVKLTGSGVSDAGKGVEEASNGMRNLVIAAAVVGAAYAYAKHKKVL